MVHVTPLEVKTETKLIQSEAGRNYPETKRT